MCGRYAFVPKSDFYDRFEIEDRGVKAGASYNITPGATVPVITMNSPKQLVLMRWGLIPAWVKNPTIAYSTINARCEEIEKKPAYGSAFKHRRCLIPASGFYEWKRASDEGRTVKIPYWIKLKSEEIFGLAGIYENNTFSIVTTTANGIMKYIHDRMPVILHPVDEEVWLNNSEYNPEMLKKIMRPFESDQMAAIRISPRVNNPMNNDEDLIKPV